ncbi:uncharacterized protein LOC115222487 [Argonauta hians]
MSHCLLQGKRFYGREWAFAKILSSLERHDGAQSSSSVAAVHSNNGSEAAAHSGEDHAMTSAVTGAPGGGVLVTGGAGCGKSALLCELVWPAGGAATTTSSDSSKDRDGWGMVSNCALSSCSGAGMVYGPGIRSGIGFASNDGDSGIGSTRDRDRDRQGRGTVSNPAVSSSVANISSYGSGMVSVAGGENSSIRFGSNDGDSGIGNSRFKDRDSQIPVASGSVGNFCHSKTDRDYGVVSSRNKDSRISTHNPTCGNVIRGSDGDSGIESSRIRETGSRIPVSHPLSGNVSCDISSGSGVDKDRDGYRISVSGGYNRNDGRGSEEGQGEGRRDGGRQGFNPNCVPAFVSIAADAIAKTMAGDDNPSMEATTSTNNNYEPNTKDDIDINVATSSNNNDDVVNVKTQAYHRNINLCVNSTAANNNDDEVSITATTSPKDNNSLTMNTNISATNNNGEFNGNNTAPMRTNDGVIVNGTSPTEVRKASMKIPPVVATETTRTTLPQVPGQSQAHTHANSRPHRSCVPSHCCCCRRWRCYNNTTTNTTTSTTTTNNNSSNDNNNNSNCNNNNNNNNHSNDDNDEDMADLNSQQSSPLPPLPPLPQTSMPLQGTNVSTPFPPPNIWHDSAVSTAATNSSLSPPVPPKASRTSSESTSVISSSLGTGTVAPPEENKMKRQHSLNRRVLAYHFCQAHDTRTLSLSGFVLNVVDQIRRSNLVDGYAEFLDHALAEIDDKAMCSSAGDYCGASGCSSYSCYGTGCRCCCYTNQDNNGAVDSSNNDSCYNDKHYCCDHNINGEEQQHAEGEDENMEKIFDDQNINLNDDTIGAERNEEPGSVTIRTCTDPNELEPVIAQWKVEEEEQEEQQRVDSKIECDDEDNDELLFGTRDYFVLENRHDYDDQNDKVDINSGIGFENASRASDFAALGLCVSKKNGPGQNKSQWVTGKGDICNESKMRYERSPNSMGADQVQTKDIFIPPASESSGERIALSAKEVPGKKGKLLDENKKDADKRDKILIKKEADQEEKKKMKRDKVQLRKDVEQEEKKKSRREKVPLKKEVVEKKDKLADKDKKAGEQMSSGLNKGSKTHHQHHSDLDAPRVSASHKSDNLGMTESEKKAELNKDNKHKMTANNMSSSPMKENFRKEAKSRIPCCHCYNNDGGGCCPSNFSKNMSSCDDKSAHTLPTAAYLRAEVIERDVVEAFRRLVLLPLSTVVTPPPHSLLLIVDAIDESFLRPGWLDHLNNSGSDELEEAKDHAGDTKFQEQQQLQYRSGTSHASCHYNNQHYGHHYHHHHHCVHHQNRHKHEHFHHESNLHHRSNDFGMMLEERASEYKYSDESDYQHHIYHHHHHHNHDSNHHHCHHNHPHPHHNCYCCSKNNGANSNYFEDGVSGGGGGGGGGSDGSVNNLEKEKVAIEKDENIEKVKEEKAKHFKNLKDDFAHEEDYDVDAKLKAEEIKRTKKLVQKDKVKNLSKLETECRDRDRMGESVDDFNGKKKDEKIELKQERLKMDQKVKHIQSTVKDYDDYKGESYYDGSTSDIKKERTEEKLKMLEIKAKYLKNAVGDYKAYKGEDLATDDDNGDEDEDINDYDIDVDEDEEDNEDFEMDKKGKYKEIERKLKNVVHKSKHLPNVEKKYKKDYYYVSDDRYKKKTEEEEEDELSMKLIMLANKTKNLSKEKDFYEVRSKGDYDYDEDDDDEEDYIIEESKKTEMDLKAKKKKQKRNAWGDYGNYSGGYDDDVDDDDDDDDDTDNVKDDNFRVKKIGEDKKIDDEEKKRKLKIQIEQNKVKCLTNLKESYNNDDHYYYLDNERKKEEIKKTEDLDAKRKKQVLKIYQDKVKNFPNTKEDYNDEYCGSKKKEEIKKSLQECKKRQNQKTSQDKAIYLQNLKYDNNDEVVGNKDYYYYNYQDEKKKKNTDDVEIKKNITSKDKLKHLPSVKDDEDLDENDDYYCYYHDEEEKKPDNESMKKLKINKLKPKRLPKVDDDEDNNYYYHDDNNDDDDEDGEKQEQCSHIKASYLSNHEGGKSETNPCHHKQNQPKQQPRHLPRPSSSPSASHHHQHDNNKDADSKTKGSPSRRQQRQYNITETRTSASESKIKMPVSSRIQNSASPTSGKTNKSSVIPGSRTSNSETQAKTKIASPSSVSRIRPSTAKAMSSPSVTRIRTPASVTPEKLRKSKRTLSPSIATGIEESTSPPAVTKPATTYSSPGSRKPNSKAPTNESTPTGIQSSTSTPMPTNASVNQPISTIAELLATTRSLFPDWLFLLCSAREHCKTVTKLFAGSGLRRVALDDLRRSHVVRDVQRYILCRLDAEPALRRHLSRQAAHTLNQLHIKSNGCMLYLETVLDGVADGSVSLAEVRHIPPTLNGLYLWICQRRFGHTPRRFAEARPLLDSVLAAAASALPLTIDQLYLCAMIRDTHLTRHEFERRLSLLSRLLVGIRMGGEGNVDILQNILQNPCKSNGWSDEKTQCCHGPWPVHKAGQTNLSECVHGHLKSRAAQLRRIGSLEDGYDQRKNNSSHLRNNLDDREPSLTEIGCVNDKPPHAGAMSRVPKNNTTTDAVTTNSCNHSSYHRDSCCFSHYSCSSHSSSSVVPSSDKKTIVTTTTTSTTTTTTPTSHSCHNPSSYTCKGQWHHCQHFKEPSLWSSWSALNLNLGLFSNDNKKSAPSLNPFPGFVSRGDQKTSIVGGDRVEAGKGEEVGVGEISDRGRGVIESSKRDDRKPITTSVTAIPPRRQQYQYHQNQKQLHQDYGQVQQQYHHNPLCYSNKNQSYERSPAYIFFHHSFAEWLLDVKHCTPRFLCSAAEGHGTLALAMMASTSLMVPGMSPSLMPNNTLWEKKTCSNGCWQMPNVGQCHKVGQGCVHNRGCLTAAEVHELGWHLIQGKFPSQGMTTTTVGKTVTVNTPSNSSTVAANSSTPAISMTANAPDTHAPDIGNEAVVAPPPPCPNISSSSVHKGMLKSVNPTTSGMAEAKTKLAASKQHRLMHLKQQYQHQHQQQQQQSQSIQSHMTTHEHLVLWLLASGLNLERCLQIGVPADQKLLRLLVDAGGTTSKSLPSSDYNHCSCNPHAETCIGDGAQFYGSNDEHTCINETANPDHQAHYLDSNSSFNDSHHIGDTNGVASNDDATTNVVASTKQRTDVRIDASGLRKSSSRTSGNFSEDHHSEAKEKTSEKLEKPAETTTNTTTTTTTPTTTTTINTSTTCINSHSSNSNQKHGQSSNIRLSPNKQIESSQPGAGIDEVTAISPGQQQQQQHQANSMSSTCNRDSNNNNDDNDDDDKGGHGNDHGEDFIGAGRGTSRGSHSKNNFTGSNVIPTSASMPCELKSDNVSLSKNEAKDFVYEHRLNATLERLRQLHSSGEAAESIGSPDVDSEAAELSAILHECSARGDAKSTVDLLSLGANPCISDDYGQTALNIAARQGHLPVVEVLLESPQASQLLDVADNDGWTPLRSAAWGGHTGVVEALLASGAEVDRCDAGGRTALRAAAWGGRESAVRCLLAHNADVNRCDSEGRTALIAAAYMGHASIVEHLLDVGASVDHEDADGRTALSVAASLCGTGFVAYVSPGTINQDVDESEYNTQLRNANIRGEEEDIDGTKNGLEEQVDLGAGENKKYQVANNNASKGEMVDAISGIERPKDKTVSPLSQGHDKSLPHQNVSSGTTSNGLLLGDQQLEYQRQNHDAVVALLLARGAFVDHRDLDGATPLLVAAHEGREEACELLLEWDADVDAADTAGRTPLLAAAAAGHAGVVRQLLYWNAAVDAIDGEGRTVLSVAAAQGDADVVGLLLERGLDEMHKDNAGWTPLHMAAYEGHRKVCDILIEHGAKVNETDNDGRHALILAAQEGNLSVVEGLLRHGASVDQRSHDGKTALRVSCLEGHEAVASLLLLGHPYPPDRGCGLALVGEGTGDVEGVEGEPYSSSPPVPPQPGPRRRRRRGYNPQSRGLHSPETLLLHSPSHSPTQSPSHSHKLHTHLQLPDPNAELHSHASPPPLPPMTQVGEATQADAESANTNCHNLSPSPPPLPPRRRSPTRNRLRNSASATPPSSSVDPASSSSSSAFVPAAIVTSTPPPPSSSTSAAAATAATASPTSSTAPNASAALVPARRKQRGCGSGGGGSSGGGPAGYNAGGGSGVGVGVGGGGTGAGGAGSILGSGCLADPNYRDADGRSTLYVLALENRVNMAAFLLANGADVEGVDPEGRTALHVAAWQGHVDMVRLLADVGGADLDAADNEQRTPLQSAAWRGHADVARELLRRGAAVDRACSQGATALCVASQEGHAGVVRALLSHGADPSRADRYGRTPLRVALKSGHREVYALLMRVARHGRIGHSDHQVALSGERANMEYGEFYDESLVHVDNDCDDDYEYYDDNVDDDKVRHRNHHHHHHHHQQHHNNDNNGGRRRGNFMVEANPAMQDQLSLASPTPPPLPPRSRVDVDAANADGNMTIDASPTVAVGAAADVNDAEYIAQVSKHRPHQQYLQYQRRVHRDSNHSSGGGGGGGGGGSSGSSNITPSGSSSNEMNFQRRQNRHRHSRLQEDKTRRSRQQ